MSKFFLMMSLLMVISACGKHSKNHQTAITEVKPPVATSTPLTPKEEGFVEEVKDEFKLPEASVETIKTELEQIPDAYTKSNIMFCAGAGGAAVIDIANFVCRSLKGDKISMSLMGMGFSFAVHTDVLVLYAKKGSRHLKEGTYTVTLGGIHLGFGVMGLKIFNENKSIDWRMKGLSLGLGLDYTLGKIVINKI
jgi:hypothetical protein